MEEKSSLSPVSLLVSILKYSIATIINFLIYGISLLLVGWLVDPAVWGKVDIFISTSTLFMNICILGLDQSFIRFSTSHHIRWTKPDCSAPVLVCPPW